MIQQGDTVELHYASGAFQAEVVHTPQGAGDSWQVRKLPSGGMMLINVYCSSFVGMVKVADAASCSHCHDGTLVWNEAQRARACWICGKAEEA